MNSSTYVILLSREVALCDKLKQIAKATFADHDPGFAAAVETADSLQIADWLIQHYEKAARIIEDAIAAAALEELEDTNGEGGQL